MADKSERRPQDSARVTAPRAAEAGALVFKPFVDIFENEKGIRPNVTTVALAPAVDVKKTTSGLQYSYRGRLALRAIDAHATGLVAVDDQRFDGLRELLSTIDVPADQKHATQ